MDFNTFVSHIHGRYCVKRMKNYAAEYTVLIVDDIPTNIMLAQVILKKEGYSILTAENGAKALQLANSHRPHIILLDVMMPDMDGYEVLKQLKSSPDTNHIPVIIMSALNDMISILKGYQMGATEYVTKPFQREELTKRIAHRFELYCMERMQTELESTMEARDMLHAVISHDLRAPIGTLKMMNSSVLRMIDKTVIGEAAWEMLLTINTIAEDTFQLLDNLTKWSKYSQQKIQPYKQSTDISSLIDSILSVYIPIAEQKRISISLERPEENLQGMIDIDMLKTIVRNLFSNAVQYSDEGGNIHILFRKEDNLMFFSIKDTGVGIKEEDKERILSPSFAMHIHQEHPISGLGVFIAKAFIELHGGKMGFESEEGKGARFFFSLPVYEEEPND